ncbi:MAG: response regulator, partial [Clostridia bacterium]|nr:response regulator [Clostridia bacterium]
MNREIRILIADENGELRKKVKELLESRAAGTVSEAENGDAAFQSIKRDDFDVVICDAWLPGIDGISLIRRSGEYLGSRSPAFILTTQVPSQTVFVEANRAGAELCLTKPIDYSA